MFSTMYKCIYLTLNINSDNQKIFFKINHSHAMENPSNPSKIYRKCAFNCSIPLQLLINLITQHKLLISFKT